MGIGEKEVKSEPAQLGKQSVGETLRWAASPT